MVSGEYLFCRRDEVIYGQAIAGPLIGGREQWRAILNQPVWRLHLLPANFANPFPGLPCGQPPGSAPKGTLTKKTELSLASAHG